MDLESGRSYEQTKELTLREELDALKGEPLQQAGSDVFCALQKHDDSEVQTIIDRVLNVYEKEISQKFETMLSKKDMYGNILVDSRNVTLRDFCKIFLLETFAEKERKSLFDLLAELGGGEVTKETQQLQLEQQPIVPFKAEAKYTSNESGRRKFRDYTTVALETIIASPDRIKSFIVDASGSITPEKLQQMRASLVAMDEKYHFEQQKTGFIFLSGVNSIADKKNYSDTELYFHLQPISYLALLARIDALTGKNLQGCTPLYKASIIAGYTAPKDQQGSFVVLTDGASDVQSRGYGDQETIVSTTPMTAMMQTQYEKSIVLQYETKDIPRYTSENRIGKYAERVHSDGAVTVALDPKEIITSISREPSRSYSFSCEVPGKAEVGTTVDVRFQATTSVSPVMQGRDLPDFSDVAMLQDTQVQIRGNSITFSGLPPMKDGQTLRVRFYYPIQKSLEQRNYREASENHIFLCDYTASMRSYLTPLERFSTTDAGASKVIAFQANNDGRFRGNKTLYDRSSNQRRGMEVGGKTPGYLSILSLFGPVNYRSRTTQSDVLGSLFDISGRGREIEYLRFKNPSALEAYRGKTITMVTDGGFNVGRSLQSFFERNGSELGAELASRNITFNIIHIGSLHPEHITALTPFATATGGTVTSYSGTSSDFPEFLQNYVSDPTASATTTSDWKSLTIEVIDPKNPNSSSTPHYNYKNPNNILVEVDH